MARKFLFKRGSGKPSTLEYGELALSTAEPINGGGTPDSGFVNDLYTKNSGNEIVSLINKTATAKYASELKVSDVNNGTTNISIDTAFKNNLFNINGGETNEVITLSYTQDTNSKPFYTIIFNNTLSIKRSVKVNGVMTGVKNTYDIEPNEVKVLSLYNLNSGIVITKSATQENIDLPVQSEYFECAGLKWMRTNLGASTETEKGRYYPWGGKTGYTDNSVFKGTFDDPLGNMLFGKSETQLKEMGAIDKNSNLNPAYDAVVQTLGDGWRMPTLEEFQSLLANTDYTWVNNFKESGVKGAKLTLKDGSDYLFFPASGSIVDGSIMGVNNEGRFWCSSFDNTGNTLSYSIDFISDRATESTSNCYWGLSVRGVKTL